jgi:hypothetical protein
LHDAVRIRDEGMVKKLMQADPELANYPKDQGISPLYLAILLHAYSIADTLDSKSNGNLSYSGTNGQNALHIAILRNTGTCQMHPFFFPTHKSGVCDTYMLAYPFSYTFLLVHIFWGLILLWFRNYMLTHKICFTISS